MRELFLAIVIVSACSASGARTHGKVVVDCFDRIEHEVPAREPVTLYTTDSVSITGINPTVNRVSSVSYLTVVSDSGTTVGRLIPFDKIDSLTFRGLGSRRGTYTGLGLLLGVVAGAAIGVSSAAETNRNSGGIFNVSGVGSGVVGGMLGGLAGALLGSAVGKHQMITITLKCR